ncbi:hypothetical protein E3N88_33709 [Mikania micrantha]|uniref:Uncharacterized protein n=1 Tax=Mikania micrantha TaxID=192012 RepID=A0A5N6MEL2_9ASTR|nr:hypothetical protein E3N88_33709 [Mikania micrantha]
MDSTTQELKHRAKDQTPTVIDQDDDTSVGIILMCQWDSTFRSRKERSSKKEDRHIAGRKKAPVIARPFPGKKNRSLAVAGRKIGEKTVAGNYSGVETDELKVQRQRKRPMAEKSRQRPTCFWPEKNPNKISSFGRKRRSNMTQKSRRPAIPRRGIRSLAVGIAIPLALTLANITMCGWNRSYRTIQKPFWIPPLWALHLTCLSSAFVMGLSAWLVWAEGGFHENPASVGFYLGQLVLSLTWDTVFFKMGATRLGLLVCLGQMAAMLSCYRMFGRVNRTAGDLVKLCLIWEWLEGACSISLGRVKVNEWAENGSGGKVRILSTISGDKSPPKVSLLLVNEKKRSQPLISTVGSDVCRSALLVAAIAPVAANVVAANGLFLVVVLFFPILSLTLV